MLRSHHGAHVWKCLYGMSEEERESLDNALNYSGDMQAVQKDLEE